MTTPEQNLLELNLKAKKAYSTEQHKFKQPSDFDWVFPDWFTKPTSKSKSVTGFTVVLKSL